ncbi:aromatic-ring-hydroxylating dioxygenase subunit beta [soil metagenome]
MEIDDNETVDRQDLIDFVWREAEMLDRQDYDAWLDLWTEDGIYIVPTACDALDDYVAVVNIAYDDAEMRAARIKRLASGFATSSAPSARTARTVSRFVIDRLNANVVEVRTAMILAEYKYQRMRTMAANVDYRLETRGGRLMLKRKVVRLISAEDYQHGIGYLF